MKIEGGDDVMKRARDWDYEYHNKRVREEDNALSLILSSSSINVYPTLLMEPKFDRKYCCRVKVRFPDGRRITRNFLYTSSLTQLFAFCYSQIDVDRAFRLALIIPRATEYLNYNNIADLTFADSGLTSSMVSLIWD
ncbi:hypothetical protein ACFE04_015185 [Oxalis oulophora]